MKYNHNKMPEERENLISKIMCNRLTLLFGAIGIGKSTLLQEVGAELARSDRKYLDVVYFRDFRWISEPTMALKNAVTKTLKDRKKTDADFQIHGGDTLSLKEFFNVCSAFSSHPLVVILDQFEKFFRHRHREEFEFVRQLAEAVNDHYCAAVFVICMRDKYVLELDVFKEYLPSVFENYYYLKEDYPENTETVSWRFAIKLMHRRIIKELKKIDDRR